MQSLRPIPFVLAASVVTLFVSLVIPAREAAAEVVLADNLASSQDAFGSVRANSWQAQSFSTTATGTVINSITVPIRLVSGATGSLQLFIYNDAGIDGTPGVSVTGSTPVATLPYSSAPSLVTNVPFTGLNQALSASATYFLVLAATGSDIYEWAFTFSTSGVGFPSNWTISNDAGASWETPLTDYVPQMMRITALSPVPEPSTYAMTLAGLACGGFSMWRRRKRA